MNPLVQTQTASHGLKMLQVHRFEHQAMATIFEIYISHPDSEYAAQAAFDCFAALDRLEQELSRFIPNSDVSRINHLDEGHEVTVSLDTFNCLNAAKQIYKETHGAFDLTVGNLVDFWKAKGSLKKNAVSETKTIYPATGMKNFLLNKKDFTLRSLKGGLNLDLGGIGKGYALDRMAGILKEWGIHQALMHSGLSTVLALSAPVNVPGWPVSLSHPQKKKRIKILSLSNQAVSGSGVQKGIHIIDPRTGYPAKSSLAAWVLASTAARADALSTAFMVMSSKEAKEYINRHKNISAFIIKDKPQRAQRKTLRTQRVINYGQLFESHL